MIASGGKEAADKEVRPPDKAAINRMAMEGDKAVQEGGKGKGGHETAFSFFIETGVRRSLAGQIK